MIRRWLGALLVVATCVPTGAEARDRRLRGALVPVARFDYAGGTELAYDGRYLFAGQSNGRGRLADAGGVRIVDTLGTPRVVGEIRCSGYDHDVAVIRPGLVALGYHSSDCGFYYDGITLFDVSDPARPRRLGDLPLMLTHWSRAHTITAVPGTDYLYVSPGGLNRELRHTSVVDVSDPMRPRLVRRMSVGRTGCHDVSFFPTPRRLLAACAGGDGVVIWDATDPLRPVELARIADPEVQFAHSAEISPDGALLVVNDEAFDGHACGDPASSTGALHVYDIADVARPRRVGFVAPPRGRAARGGWDVRTWCTSHQFNFEPGSRRLAVAWFTGGVSVVDLSVPASPAVLASHRAADSLAWTGHWYGGHVWVNDMQRGLEMLAFLPVSAREVPVPLPVPLPAGAARGDAAPFGSGAPPLVCVVPEVAAARLAAARAAGAT